MWSSAEWVKLPCKKKISEFESKYANSLPQLALIKISEIYIVHFLFLISTAHYNITYILYPDISVHVAAYRRSKALQGINICWVPIYYTWVNRHNCGQNALSKGFKSTRPTDYESRARTTTPQCSQVKRLLFLFFLAIYIRMFPKSTHFCY